MDLRSVILLCASAVAVFGNFIKPNKTDVFAEEGSGVTFSCSFSASGGSDNLHWYRQYGRSKPVFLVLIYSNAKEAQQSDVDPRFSVKVEKREKNLVDLEISSAAVSDSALYYCALQPTVTGNISALYKNLLQ
ncbi:immunoglobulin iota chain-like [Sinocyclocheilus grahami]|uniref:immunoglobulin iota chain-like n=1 Tax=Sinocyclocheilus grahami TaxID=75366 RepID=UPI0007AC5BFA|nr:PREDICTED: immunoglobulin iota chain-like [Sinocyclocheilus grahami]